MLKPTRGFTIVELLMALVVLAIGATLAAPSIASMIASRRVQSLGQSLLDGLQTARAEAVRRNTRVRFSLRDDPPGWTLSEVGSGTTLRSAADPDWATVQVTSSNGAGSVDFLPNGLRQTGTQIEQLTIAGADPSQGTQRRINVFGGGLIRMCDPAVTAANDPRGC
jgi:type IV fimbrial biogenesis protein FimT